MERIAYKIYVKGKVQGVWFRKYTSNEANRIGVSGFVQNEKDNSVYLEAEGNLKQLKELVNWLYKGSPLSKVSSVEFELCELKNHDTFEIKS